MKKKNRNLTEKIAKIISKELTKADWMASFWDELDLEDKDVIRERNHLFKVAGEIIKLVRLEIENEKEI